MYLKKIPENYPIPKRKSSTSDSMSFGNNEISHGLAKEPNRATNITSEGTNVDCPGLLLDELSEATHITLGKVLLVDRFLWILSPIKTYYCTWISNVFITHGNGLIS